MYVIDRLRLQLKPLNLEEKLVHQKGRLRLQLKPLKLNHLQLRPSWSHRDTSANEVEDRQADKDQGRSRMWGPPGTYQNHSRPMWTDMHTVPSVRELAQPHILDMSTTSPGGCLECQIYCCGNECERRYKLYICDARIGIVYDRTAQGNSSHIHKYGDILFPRTTYLFKPQIFWLQTMRSNRAQKNIGAYRGGQTSHKSAKHGGSS